MSSHSPRWKRLSMQNADEMSPWYSNLLAGFWCGWWKIWVTCSSGSTTLGLEPILQLWKRLSRNYKTLSRGLRAKVVLWPSDFPSKDMEASFDNCEQHIYRRNSDSSNLFPAPPDGGRYLASHNQCRLLWHGPWEIYIIRTQLGVGKLGFWSTIEFKLV